MPPAAPPADRAEPAGHADGAGRARTTAPPRDPAAPAGPPGSVTGPVAPTAAASGSHRPLAQARLAGGLLHQWQRRNLDASLPLALRQLDDAGNLDNVRLAIQAARKTRPGRTADAEGDRITGADGYGAAGGHRPVGVGPVDPLPGTGYRGPVFMDSGIYKTLEATGWELAHGARPELASFTAQVTALLEEAQRPAAGVLGAPLGRHGSRQDVPDRRQRVTAHHRGLRRPVRTAPDRAYNETCAAIASFQWSWRLLLATGDPKYADHMERMLYNGFGAAIATGGQRFFYVNPLQRREDHFEKDDPGRRRVWFNCACCPPNIMRLIACLDHYLATESGDTLYVHQYTGSRLSGAGLDLEVTTDYPWSGAVHLRVLAAPRAARGLALRVPAWSAGTRGPLVYCFEQVDQLDGARLDDLAVRAGGVLGERPVTLDGVGQTIEVTVPSVPRTAVAIPCFQWDNRDGGPMRVWMPPADG